MRRKGLRDTGQISFVNPNKYGSRADPDSSLDVDTCGTYVMHVMLLSNQSVGNHRWLDGYIPCELKGEGPPSSLSVVLHSAAATDFSVNLRACRGRDGSSVNTGAAIGTPD